METISLQAIEAKKRELREQVKQLEAQIEALDTTLRLFAGNQLSFDAPAIGTPVRKIILGEPAVKDHPGKRLSLKSAIIHIFEVAPDRRFTPLQVKAELIAMKESGDFVTKSEDFYPAAHGVLRELRDSGFITRRDENREIYYQKA